MAVFLIFGVPKASEVLDGDSMHMIILEKAPQSCLKVVHIAIISIWQKDGTYV